MTIQLNPSINDKFDTKTLAQLRQAVFDGLGFIQPPTIGVTRQLGPLSPETTPPSLVTDIKNRLGLATPNTVAVDTFFNLRTTIKDLLGLATPNTPDLSMNRGQVRAEIFNMLGMGAQASNPPPGVNTMLNSFINEAYQMLWRAIELDTGATTPPVNIIDGAGTPGDGSVFVIDAKAVLQLALGLAKHHYGQDDGADYESLTKKYLSDFVARNPPNINAIINDYLNEAQQTLFRSIELDMGITAVPAIVPLVADNTASASSLVTAGTGSNIFTVAAGLSYPLFGGPTVRATSTSTGEWMEGAITSYSATSLTVAMTANSGTGTHTDWVINGAGKTTIDFNAVLQLAIGMTKKHFGKEDGTDYLAQSKKYLQDLLARNPPNITAIITAALQDAQRVVVQRYEFQSFRNVTLNAFAGPTDSTTIDAEPVFLLALANVKMMLKHEDGKLSLEQYETYMKDLLRYLPPEATTLVNRLLKSAQDTLYRMYKVFRMERWFTWTTVAGIRFYGVSQDDSALLSPPTGVTATVGAATTAQNMSAARFSPAVALLGNGKVLVASGFDGTSDLLSADLFDQSTGAFSPTGSMSVRREGAIAVVLSSGNVLVSGGFSTSAHNIVELYNPTTGVFSLTGSMSSPRLSHTATLLTNGKVLVCGGSNFGVVLNTAEIYDPTTGTFTLTRSMTGARQSHTATLLHTGKVLVVGGTNNGGVVQSTAELFDPVAGTFSATGPLAVGRAIHTATPLNNGLVLVVGGVITGQVTVTATAELYSANTSTFSSTGSLTTGRRAHVAVLLSNGNVIIAGGGTTAFGYLSSSELYTTATGAFSAGGAMPVALNSTTGALFPNGKVLIAGGTNGSTNLASAMLYDPVANTFAVTGSLTAGTVYYRVAAQTASGPQVVGGIITRISPGTTLASTEVSVAGVPAATSVVISWTPLIDASVTGYAIYGRATGAEQLLVVVGPTVTSYTDQGTIPPNGALPTVNTTGGVGSLDAREVTWAGLSKGDNAWSPLIKGVPPVAYNSLANGIPQFYDIRQAIEVWPPPADNTWQIRIKGYFQPSQFDADADVNSIDWQAIYLKALADAKAFYKQPDAKVVAHDLQIYIGGLIAGTHGTARYIPGAAMATNAVRPVLLDQNGNVI